MTEPPRRVDLLGQLRSSSKPLPPKRRLKVARSGSVAVAGALILAAIGIAIAVAPHFASDEPAGPAVDQPEPVPPAVDQRAEYQAYSDGENPGSAAGEQPPVAAEQRSSRRLPPATSPQQATTASTKGVTPSPERPSSPRSVPDASPTPAPYRNGTMATHLSGEALRLALLEDRRITREYNEAALRNQEASAR